MKNFNSIPKNKLQLVITALVFAIISSIPFSGFSQQENANKSLSPYFLVLSENPETDQLPLKSTTAEVNIVGVIADVTISQIYKNEGNHPLEAIYTFPASSNAAVYSMEMIVGDRKITAKIEEKQKARNQYDEARSQGKRVSLLEQQRPNVFQMNVANIQPGDEIKVNMKYTELLIPEGGKYSFVYPTVVGPRYSNQNALTASSDDNFVSNPYQREDEAPLYNFDIDLFLSTGMPIQSVKCPTHKVTIDYEKTSLAHIQLDKSETKGGNRDFVVEYQLSGNQIESGLMLYEHNDEKFFMLMMQPPKSVINEDIPPREYIFIVDVSGSMRGFPLDVSKKLLRNLVVNLRPTDKFNVLLFAGTSGWLGESSINATSENVDKACNFIDRENGGGGTELLPALEKAMSLPRYDEALSRSFVIVTDGYVTVEQEAFDLISRNCDAANTFSFGIGSSVDRYLIEGMARAGKGEPFIVMNHENADKQAEKFRKYISSPVLTQVKKDFGKFEVYDVEPISIPDVLAERPVIIYGKYKGEAKGSITITGWAGKKRYKKTFDVSSVKADKRNSAIRYLWAREKIKTLDDYNRLGQTESRVKEVTDLGLKYNLMTAYTSFIAVDEQIVENNGSLQTVKQPLPLPQNVSNSAVGFEIDLEGMDIEDLLVSFHKEIVIGKEVDEESIATLKTQIERLITKQLNACLIIDDSEPVEIEVKVDCLGNVVNVITKGDNVSNKMEQYIRECIKMWDFKKYGINKEWKFNIKF